MSTKPCILICAGGTGGHVIPGLTIARELEKKGFHIHWIGTKKGIEAKLVKQANINISYISISGVRGKNFLSWLLAPFKLMTSIIESTTLIYKIKPKAVIAMGGFAAGPSGIAAWLLRKPLVIHEQNSIAGTTNKLLAKFSMKILEGFPGSFPKNSKVVLTGNPIRPDFFKLPHPMDRFAKRKVDILRVLILGGSLGAKILNETIPATLSKWTSSTKIAVWHQTGDQNLAQTEKEYKKHGITENVAKIEPFIIDMAKAYSWADIVICRAGALTISELTAAGVGSILVPYPYAIDDHQTVNAKYLGNAGAATIIPQTDFTPNKLLDTLQSFAEKRSRAIVMAQAAFQLSNPKALDNIVDNLLSTINSA